MKTKYYRVLAATTIERLEELVNALLIMGWQLAGGVAVTEDEDEFRFFQAMHFIAPDEDCI